MIDKIGLSLLTMFGIGRIKYAPGTVASIVTCLIYYLLFSLGVNFNYFFFFIFIILLIYSIILIDKLSTEELNSVAWYLDCGDDDYLYEDSSLLHLAMKKKGVKHEYRVRDGAHTWNYWKASLPKVLGFVSIRFHRH